MVEISWRVRVASDMTATGGEAASRSENGEEQFRQDN
jgi:hypothetical protein